MALQVLNKGYAICTECLVSTPIQQDIGCFGVKLPAP